MINRDFEDSVANYMIEPEMEKIIRSGELLAEKDLPVPTAKIQAQIYCSEYRKGRFHVTYENDRVVTIDKPTYSADDDRNIPFEKYDFISCVESKYDFSFKQGNSIRDYFKYEQLSEISTYLYFENGFAFIKNERMYFLHNDRRFYYIGNVGNGVIKLEFDNRGNIVVYRVEQYKQIISNRRYERSGQDYTGYTDVYEISIKKNILKKEEFMKLLEKKRNEISNNIKNTVSTIITQEISSSVDSEIKAKCEGVVSFDKKINISKEKYWQEFVRYAFEESKNKEFINAEFPVAVPADRNWYALRLGTAKAHIELSFNTQKYTIRTALLIKDRTLFEKLEDVLAKNEMSDTVIINRESKTVSISIMKSDVDFCGDRISQFEWFMEGACLFKKLVNIVGK